MPVQESPKPTSKHPEKEDSQRPVQKESTIPREPVTEKPLDTLNEPAPRRAETEKISADKKPEKVQNKEVSEQPGNEKNIKKNTVFRSKLKGFKTKGVPTLSQLSKSGKSSDSKGENAEEAIDDLSPLDDKPASPFNQADLWKVWDEYAEQIKEADKQSYYATLTKHKVLLRDDFKLELLVDNHVQLQDLNNDKANLVGFLREQLNNWRITLKGVIDEVERDDGDSLYDPHKKFEAMAERNPAIVDLRKRFDLDVDYDS